MPAPAAVRGVGPVFDQAWTGYRLRAPLLLRLLGMWALTWVALEAMVFWLARAPGHPVWIVLHVLYLWATAYWEAAMAGCALDHFAGRSPAPRRYLVDHRLARRFLMLKIVLIPTILLGTALLLIPGIVLTARLGPAFYAAVDRSSGPREALTLARGWTRGHTFVLSRLVLALVAFNVAGAALMGLGLLLTIPMTALAGAYVFHAVSEHARPDGSPELHEALGVHPQGPASEPVAP
jgi:hypothetical protein